MSSSLYLAIGQYGTAVVVVNVLLDQLGLPVPAVPTLIVAGAVAADGRLSMPALFAGSVLACLLADCVWYLVGEKYGIRVLKMLCKISLEPDSCVSQTQTRFERWGINSLVVAKFVPGLAIIAPPMAGAMRIGWLRFIFLSTCAAVLWVALGLAAGALFKSQIGRLLEHLSEFGSIAAYGLLALLGAYIAYKWWERSRFYKVLRMARISVADLYELIQAGASPLIIDVRSNTARALEPRWIPGALHVPLQDVAHRLKELPRDRDVILYCTCPSEASAAPRRQDTHESRLQTGTAAARRARCLGRRGLRRGAGVLTHHVVIVGAGFGGLSVALGLAGADVEITIIDRRNHHLFQPLLYQVGTASLATSEIAWPIRHLMRKRKEVTTLLGTVSGVDTGNRRVLLDDGGSAGYDTLVLATGAQHAYFGHDEWEPYAPALKDTGGRHVHTAPHSAVLRTRRAGDGPTAARGLADIRHRGRGARPAWSSPVRSPNWRSRTCRRNIVTSTRAGHASC